MRLKNKDFFGVNEAIFFFGMFLHECS